MTFLTIFGNRNIIQFKLVLEGEIGKEIPGLSRLELLEKFLANNCALADAKNNTSRLLNRGSIADLPLLRTLVAIGQKSQEQGFWEVMDSLVLSTYAILAASRTLLHWLLAFLNFILDSDDLFGWCKQKKWFLWTMAAAQVLKTKKMGEVWPDICNEYIHKLQPKPTHKIH